MTRQLVVVETVLATDIATLDALVDMGDAASDTLGMLARGIYRDAALQHGLVVAREAGEAVGYALFRCPVTRPEVMLTHLCPDRSPPIRYRTDSGG